MQSRPPATSAQELVLKLVVRDVQIGGDCRFIVWKQPQIQFIVAPAHLRQQLAFGRYAAILARIHAATVTAPFTGMAGFTLCITYEFFAAGK